MSRSRKPVRLDPGEPPRKMGRPSNVQLAVDAADIPPRLRFLEDLSQRSAFEGHAILSLIITDYRRALDRARGTGLAREASR